MATSTATPTLNANSTTNIRSWAIPIHNILAAGGWVQTSDTGQTNASALPAATLANTSSGFEIWRMNDALQATAPIFLRIDYCSGGSINVPRLNLTIGTGSDGSGTITGVLLPSTGILSSGTGTGGAAPGYFSASAGRVSVFIGAGLYSLYFSIERAPDASGNPTADGLLVMGGSTFNSPVMALNINRFLSSAYAYPSSTLLGAFVPSGTTWGGAASSVGVCPVRFFHGQPSNPCLSWLTYLNADIAAGSFPQVSMYGTNRSYVAIGSGAIGTVASGNANSTLLMLWE